MVGIEAERASAVDTSISLLAYFQEDTRKSWSTHGDQHKLEDKALDLALQRVFETQQAQDHALQLAVKHATDAQESLHRLLNGRIDALEAALKVEHEELDRRSEERDKAAREVAEVRVVGAERWVTDVMQQRWATHLSLHDILSIEVNKRWDAHKTTDELAKAAADNLDVKASTAHAREHELNQRAIDIADRNMATRLAEMNALRTQITAERGLYVSRDMLDARLHASAETATGSVTTTLSRIAALERTQNIAFGIMLVLVFAIPLGLKFIP